MACIIKLKHMVGKQAAFHWTCLEDVPRFQELGHARPQEEAAQRPQRPCQSG